MQIIDKSKLTELQELDDDGSNSALKKIIKLYLTSTPEKLKNMLQFYEAKDISSIQKEAHSIRSSSLLLGAERLISIVTHLEYASEAESSSPEYGDKIREAATEFEAVKTVLETYL